MNSASNSATIFSRSAWLMVRSSRAPSTSAFSSSCLKNFKSLLADGLPIATRIAAAFCVRVIFLRSAHADALPAPLSGRHVIRPASPRC